MATGSVTPFRPIGTVSLNAGTSSAVVQLPGGGESVVITNMAASLTYVRFGSDPSVTATTSDMPIMANSRAMLSVNDLITYAAAMLATGSGTVFFTRGDGSYV